MPFKVWRVLYPIGVHFAAGQILSYAALLWPPAAALINEGNFVRITMLMTGLTAIAAVLLLAHPFYADMKARIRTGLLPPDTAVFPGFGQACLLFVMGAGFAETFNLVISLCGAWLPLDEYSQTMGEVLEGKTLLSMIFWVGIICPIAEEVVFRFMVYLRLRDNLRFILAALISGILFGIYHGEPAQGVYAALMGFAFAALVEYSHRAGASVFMHIGANTWSLVVSEALTRYMNAHPEVPMEQISVIYLSGALILFLITIAGTAWYRKKYKKGL